MFENNKKIGFIIPLSLVLEIIVMITIIFFIINKNWLFSLLIYSLISIICFFIFNWISTDKYFKVTHWKTKTYYFFFFNKFTFHKLTFNNSIMIIQDNLFDLFEIWFFLPCPEPDAPAPAPDADYIEPDEDSWDDDLSENELDDEQIEEQENRDPQDRSEN